MKNIIIIVFTILAITSCKDDDDVKVGSVNLNFNNSIENTSIIMNNTSYTNKSGETYTISQLKYIISNIVFIKANGEEFKYPTEKSYFLINEEVAESKTIELNTISEGEYTKIRFGIGVDQSKYPLHRTNNFIPTAQENEMLWSWSAGYIFLKFEGGYSVGGQENTDFKIHIGSHGTTLDNYKEVILDLPNTLNIKENATSRVVINADIAKIFDSVNTHSLSIKSDIQVDPENAPKIAENSATMFSAASINE
ncbi:MbnP family protein [Aquimarina muelleri]|uniref:Copper-binding protein MbnP-like domain-containing protein n=1 Tax=Aquimarina muelleri TaxID=279356 RepID=A0A918JWI0_9FLAO|nr:MbnP family protein [Aquimarina muelleri]MCX2763210.1 hypothetical protein [Aquimarina muelleri]GGX19971.1 hypothetical protein GCM10007384_21680 [Aquimarina muelleri]